MGDKGERPKHLRGLNNAQYSAVVHDPEVPLQILAGPGSSPIVNPVFRNVTCRTTAGSGKTRTLTYRITHLINEHGVQASKIVAVTFTNKAASELKNRLHNLIGESSASALILGINVL